jgi:hypothetical protein
MSCSCCCLVLECCSLNRLKTLSHTHASQQVHTPRSPLGATRPAPSLHGLRSVSVGRQGAALSARPGLPRSQTRGRPGRAGAPHHSSRRPIGPPSKFLLLEGQGQNLWIFGALVVAVGAVVYWSWGNGDFAWTNLQPFMPSLDALYPKEGTPKKAVPAPRRGPSRKVKSQGVGSVTPTRRRRSWESPSRSPKAARV